MSIETQIQAIRAEMQAARLKLRKAKRLSDAVEVVRLSGYIAGLNVALGLVKKSAELAY